MKLPIKRTSGKVDLSEIRMLLYGPPKIGKSTLLSGFPDTLFLATEKGYGALKVYATDIKSWKDFTEAVELIVDGEHNYKTICIDTADILVSLCLDYICDELDITHISDEDWGKGYDVFSKAFEKELNKLFMSPYGLIMTSHTKTSELTSRTGKITKTVPTLSNQARRIIIPKVSLIGYMGMKTVKIDKNTYVEKRYLSFEPSETLEAGDRDGKMPEQFIVPKDPLKTYKIFADAYAK